jgi:hypothetical protein
MKKHESQRDHFARIRNRKGVELSSGGRFKRFHAHTGQVSSFFQKQSI